ncbi:MAG: OmpA family protein, partial [Bacillota bacterium]|nr:OmpA family protein [Bacillota bacterium]
SGNVKIMPMDPLDEVYQELSQYISKNNLGNEITLQNSDSFVRIRIEGVLMFYPDSPQLLDSSKPIIKTIAQALIKIYDRIDRITISGHTATMGEYTKQNNAFAWSLSVNRANTVRESLTECGLKEGKISLEGYGHNVPIAPNSTEAGRSKNRRAEITVYKNTIQK